jgi:diguanylate cyclase (GGDEF)-like protein/PAS domain S-box-containing protein
MDMQASGTFFRRAFGPRLRLVLFFALTWLGVAVLLAFLLHDGYRAAERKAESDVLAAAGLLEARLATTLRRVQGDLEHLAEMLPPDVFKPGAAGHFREQVVRELGLHARGFSEIVGFRVLDATGNPLYVAGWSVQSAGALDQACLNASTAGNGRIPHFSAVNVDRLSGRSTMAIALAVPDATGGVHGVVIALLDIGALARMSETLNVGAGGVVSIRRIEDGRLVLRRPAMPELLNQPGKDDPLHARAVEGNGKAAYRFAAPMDGVERIYGFQRIGEYPLYVTTGIATADFLSDWRQTLFMAVASAALLFLALSLVLIRLLRAGQEEDLTAGKLVESEARYRMLAENSHDVIWTLDIPSRRYTYVSPSVTELCGYLPEEVVGQALEATLTAESAGRIVREVDQRLRRIAAGDKAAGVVVSELEQRCKDGSVISTEVVSSYLLDAEGVPQTILGITRNVSERKAAETALRETNRQLHARIEEIGRLQVALQELAVRDSLTGLYNRRYLDETLEREVSRARREGNPLSLVMLDIDHFKKVNDTYGHQVGDEALRMLASTLLADIRAEDVACRYGGEEFLILLPNMPLETAMLRAEAWRGAVEGVCVALGNFRITFTISLGVAAYPEHGKTPDDLTRCADQALYRAKNDGRNRVSVFFA